MRVERSLAVHTAAPRDGSAPSVFLVHGAGGCAAQWRHVVLALLDAGCGVVTYDALGHGESPAPQR